MIEKGILFGKEDIYKHLYAGFYDEKINNKTEFIQLIKKICGEYTDCWMGGVTINLFDSHLPGKKDDITKEGITVVHFEGFYNAFRGDRDKIFRENPEAVERFEALRRNLRGIRGLSDVFPTKEQREEKLKLIKETEEKYSKELDNLGGMVTALRGDYLFRDTLPNTLQLELNFLERIERTAKETGLEHLIALPLFGGNKDAVKESIWTYHTTKDDIWMLLEKARKEEPLYAERLRLGYSGPEKDELPTKILERTLSILKEGKFLLER